MCTVTFRLRSTCHAFSLWCWTRYRCYSVDVNLSQTHHTTQPTHHRI